MSDGGLGGSRALGARAGLQTRERTSFPDEKNTAVAELLASARRLSTAERPGSQQSQVSALVASVLDDFDAGSKFDQANVEDLLERPRTSQSISSSRASWGC
jgi:hypothetical protein